MEKIEISAGDFLKNAGIAGLNYLLECCDALEGIDYGISGDEQTFWLDYEFAASSDWTDMYFRAFIECFQDVTAYSQVMDKISIILNASKRDEWEADKFKDDLKFINDKLLSNSYKSGFKNIQDKINDPEVYVLLEKSKLKPSMGDELIDRLRQLQEFLKQPLCKETFCMKSIIYNVINRFWDGKSFLLRANAAKDMRTMYEQDFAAPFKKYISSDHEKAKERCIDCENKISNSDRVSIAFMTERADDLARKRSAFWNCKVDAFLCPVCALLYSLAPLGFQLVGSRFLFVNECRSVRALVESNRKSGVSRKDTEEKYSHWIARTINILLKEDTKKLENIQVIIRGTADTDRYFMNVIGKDVVELLKNDKISGVLKSLAEHPYVKVKKDYWNVHEEAVLNMLQYRSQYGAINKLMKLSLDKVSGDQNEANKNSSLIKAEMLYRIQLIVSVKHIQNIKEGMLMDTDELKWIKNKGYELRKALLDAKGTSDDSCLRGMIYKLLNLLSVNDWQKFMDIVMRVYCSTKLQIPDALIKVIGNAELFQMYGYAFVLGIQGSYFEKIGGAK